MIASPPRTKRGGWHRILLISIVVAYMGVLIIAPLAALVVGAFEQGSARSARP